MCNPNAATCDTTIGHCSTTTTASCNVNSDCNSQTPAGQTCVGMCTGANCCCLSQCRPYIVIMLTDGDETCTGTTTVGTCSVSGSTCYINAQCPSGQTCTGAGTEGQAAAAMLYTNVHAFAITNIVRAVSGVITVTTASAHTLAAGNSVVINGVTNTAYNGTYTIATVPAAPATTFTINTGVLTAIAASSGGYASLNDPVTITSIARTGGTVTVTTAAHTLQVTQNVVIAGVSNASFNGTYVVTSATATQFTYVQAALPNVANANLGGTAAHAALLYRYQVVTHPIGFGTGDPYTNIEYIAHAGGEADVPGVDEGYYANDEAGLELAISTIVAKSLRSESCNNLDDDCDTKIDEDFPTKGQPCDNGEKGVCLVDGTLVCRPDGTGVQCNAGSSGCTGKADGSSCTVQNAAGATVNGTCANGVSGMNGSCDPGPNNTTEICGNGIDDDCDGLIDEGCGSCVPTSEICNGLDDDCDLHIDQSCRCSNNNSQICTANGDCGGANTCNCTPITRSCGQGACLGTQTCNFGLPGHYTACTAPTACTPGNCSVHTATSCTQDSQCPVGETCNNAGPDCGICDGNDNDCDGICDGFTEGCSNIGNGNPANNLGDPSHNPIPQNICHPGEKTCPQSCAGTNSFGACIGEVAGCNPTQDGTIHCDTCDGVDNDCDNKIDEDFVPTACTGSCGVGVTQCINGVVSCNAMQGTSDTTCDGIDDDCDGQIDEDWVCDATPGCVGPNCCECGTGTTCEQTKCIAGHLTCVTSPAITVETCNCLDDDCDGKIDEGSLCGAGASCVNCQCAYACNGGEFPCPLGKKCSPTMFCINDPCYGVTCPAVNGNVQSCFDNGDNTSKCVDTCSLQCDANNLCPSGMNCVGGMCGCQSPLACDPANGQCLPNDCTTYPDRCTANQNCINGVCVTNPCQGVTCPDAQYCVTGQCYGSCAGVDCPTGQRCRLGTCETDPCGQDCPFGKVCNDSTGQCIDDPCPFRDCPEGQWCNPNDGGMCEDDPCVGTMCPAAGQVCKGGTCYDPSQFEPDGGTAQHVTVGGGGCNTGDDTSGGGVLLLGTVALMMSRRRRGGRS